MVLGMVADMGVDKVANIEVEMMAGMEVDMVADINTNIDIDIEIQFWSRLARLCEFIDFDICDMTIIERLKITPTYSRL